MVIHRLEIPTWCWAVVVVLASIHLAVKYLKVTD
jgi:hypothetical protein